MDRVKALLKRKLVGRVRPGASDPEKPLEDDLEMFLCMIRFDGRGKLDEMPIE